MTTNRLAKTTDPVIDRSSWTLHEHCEYANAQLILKGVNDERRMKGLGPVHWVIRDGRVVCEGKPALAIADRSAQRQDGATRLGPEGESGGGEGNRPDLVR